ncbi:MAG: nitric oxide reductase [Leptospira sp.]|nr:nitric oxide reductase [Leptospira sp.]
MEWDQFLFYKGHKLYKKLKRILDEPNPFFNYEILKEEVTILKFLLILNSNPIQLSISRDRIALSKDILYFPESIHLLEDEESSKKFIRLLFTFLSIALNINISYAKSPMEKIYLSSQSFQDLYRIARNRYSAIHLEWREIMQSLRRIRKYHRDHYNQLKKSLLNSPRSVNLDSISNFSGKDFVSHKEKNSLETKDAEQKINLDEAELIEVDEKKIEEYTLGHNFEKIETVEEFDGNWRDIDGEEDMEEEEALQELNLKHVIRTEDAVHTTNTTDSGSGSMLELNSNIEDYTRLYPEWDYKKRIYKKDYCSIKEENFIDTDSIYVTKILTQKSRNLEKLNKSLEILINELQTKKRLASGPNIDLDAFITRLADIKAHKTPSEFIYTDSRKHNTDISLFFLMDLSLSTDSWIHGKRILDVEKESMILFSECLHNLKIPFGIGGFYSRTRNHCKFLTVKKISEDWSVCKNRMGALSPIGYTRIGPALRHALSFLKDSKTKQNWIILLTDAKPNDYDTYEGKYGIEDVNQAIKECLLEKVQLHTLAIGLDEKPTIPAMMREASFQMLFDPDKLLDSLQIFLKRALSR